VLLNQEPIRHAGHVITHRAVQSDDLNANSRAARHLCGMGQVEIEDFPEHADSPSIRLIDRRIVVKIAVKVFSQLQVGPTAFDTVADQRPTMGTHLVHGSDPGRGNVVKGGLDHIGHLLIDDLSDRVIAAAFRRQDPEPPLHLPGSARPHLHLRLQLLLIQQSGIKAVIKVMTVVGNFVGKIGDLGFQRWLMTRESFSARGDPKVGLMFRQSLPHLPGEVQSGKIRILPLQFLHHPQALSIVLESILPLHEAIQRVFPLVSKGRVTQVMGQRNGFRQVLIQAQRTRQIPGDRRHLHGVRQARAQVIPGAIQKHLRFVLQPPKGAAVDDPVAVPLELGPPDRRLLLMNPSTAVTAVLGKRRKKLPLTPFKRLAGDRITRNRGQGTMGHNAPRMPAGRLGCHAAY
jgi:hypothetical protein